MINKVYDMLVFKINTIVVCGDKFNEYFKLKYAKISIFSPQHIFDSQINNKMAVMYVH